MRAATLAALLGLLCACREPASGCVVVEVVQAGHPVAGAEVTLRSIPGDQALSWRTSPASGVVRFDHVAAGPVTVQVLLVGEERGGFATRRIEVGRAEARLRVDLEESAAQTRVIRAFQRSTGPGVDCGGVRLAYDRAELAQDRRRRLLLEIDRVAGLPQPALAVETTAGRLRLEEIFAAVGLELEVVADGQVPAAELGPDAWPGEQRLRRIMQQHRSLSPPPDVWFVYLLLIPQREPGFEHSCLLDPQTRSGAVVSIPPEPDHPGAILHAIGHELGHLLNLPHPWDSYGNTRSLMSYPWRWTVWEWSDPTGYHFDAVGRHHILRGPDEVVRPGAGPFLELEIVER